MASVKIRATSCPRCSQPTTLMDLWPESRCGFCQWVLSDPGVQCVKCSTINPSEAADCRSCYSIL